MSVLSSTYYEDLPDLDRYGKQDDDRVLTLHVAACYFEHIHISLDTWSAYNEANITIETAEALVEGLQAAIASARKGRELRRD